MITAEYKRDAINSLLDEYGLSREEFLKDPQFLDNLDDKDAYTRNLYGGIIIINLK